MASVVYITELSDFDRNNGNTVEVAALPVINSQTVAAGAASAQSTALKNNTRYVRIQNDSGGAACIEFGTNPTAVAGTSMRIGANSVPEYFAVPMGQGFKVAAIANAT